MPKGNPNPVMTREFAEKQFKRSDQTTEALANKPTPVRLPKSIDLAVRSLPKRSAWLRKVITEAAYRDGLVQK